MRKSHRRILSLGCFILLLAGCGASQERVGAYLRRWLGWARIMGMAVVVMMVMGGGGLVGCAISSSAGQKTIADSEMRKRIVVGATTKGEVKALLGEPETLGMDEGEETWGYVYVAGGQVRWIGTTGEMSELIIRFTKRGIVKEKGYGGGKLFTSGTKQIRDNGSGSSIKPGQTTKTEVEALFGRPYRVYAYEVLAGPEEEEWVFMYMDEGIVAPALAGAGIGLLSGLPFVGTISAVVAGKVMYSDKRLMHFTQVNDS